MLFYLKIGPKFGLKNRSISLFQLFQCLLLHDPSSSDNDAMHLYPSAPEVSEQDGVIPASAGINSLNIGGNQWRVDSTLNSID